MKTPLFYCAKCDQPIREVEHYHDGMDNYHVLAKCHGDSEEQVWDADAIFALYPGQAITFFSGDQA
jgi:hypothetical protein